MLALAAVVFVLAISLSPNARAAPPRSYYELTVYINQQDSPTIEFRFYLKYAAPLNTTGSPYPSQRIDFSAGVSDELIVDGTEGGNWTDVQWNVFGDTNFTKTARISNETQAEIAANTGTNIVASVNVTVVYTDESGSRPRTIFRSVTFLLSYQAPGKIEFQGAVLAGLGGAGAVGIALYVGRRARLQELFLMHNSGTLIRHWTHSDGPVNDGDAVSGMLLVLQDFVRDSFDDRENSLQELRFGKHRVVLVGGRHTILAAVVRGRFLNDLPGRLQQAVWEFEGSSADVLPSWDKNADLSSRADLLAMRFLRFRHRGIAA